MIDRTVTTKGPCRLSASNHLFPSLTPVATILLDCTTAHTEDGSVTERGAPRLPYPAISMLNLYCQLISQHSLAGSREGLAESNSFTPKKQSLALSAEMPIPVKNR